VDRGLPPPLHFLSAPGASSGQTSVHAVEEPWLPLENLSANAPGAAGPQCALKGGRPLLVEFKHIVGFWCCVLQALRWQRRLQTSSSW
jgi:hypothetical protein